MSDVLEKTILAQSFVKADTRLVAIGKTGVGKSSTCNSLIGRVAFAAYVGASSVTKECKQEIAQRVGRTIQVVDTPGFFDTQVVNEISNKITECVSLLSPGPHAFLFVIRIGRFTEEDKKTIGQAKKWFGEDMLKHTVVVFTGQDDLDADEVAIRDYISSSPEPLKQLLAQINNRYLTVNNRGSEEGKGSFTKNLLTMVDAMVSVNGGTWYTTDMYRQAEQRIKQRKEQEIRRKRDEIEQSIKSKYSKLISNQEQQLQKLQTEMSNLQRLGQNKNVQYADKVAELNQKLVQVKQQREQIDKDRRRWENNLQAQINTSGDARNAALMAFKNQLDTAINKKEAEVSSFSARIEQERVAREREINRRAEEKRRREQEEHSRRMAALEEKTRRQKEEQRQERERQARREEELRRQREEQEAEERRRRHRHNNGCTVC